MTDHTLHRDDSTFLKGLRALAIVVIVFGHVGGFWLFCPYSEYLHVFVPVFFFLSGSVLYFSYQRASGLRSYWMRRAIGLLVPYYLACILWLLLYIVYQHAIPNFSFDGMMNWLAIRPIDSGRGMFSLSQVWFLHTLLIISILSPLWFAWYASKRAWLGAYVVFALAMATVELFTDVHQYFCIAGHDLFKPLVHSIFFILGFVFFTVPVLRRMGLQLAIATTLTILSIGMASTLKLDVDLAHHTYSPDLYYVTCSIAAIALLMACRPLAVLAMARIKTVRWSVDFLHRYTFPIYLLHKLPIRISEDVCGLTKVEGGGVLLYGGVKFAVVFLGTCVLAVPFGKLSEIVLAYCRERLDP